MVSWCSWWQLQHLHCLTNWGSVYNGSFFVKWIWNRYQISGIESECRNKNDNKIKDTKYLKQNNQIQTVVRLHFRYLCLNYPIKISTTYVLMSLPCMTSSSFILRLFIGWFRHKYQNFSRTTVCIWLFCFKYLLPFILLVFWLRRSDSSSSIWYIFQIHFYEKVTFLHWPPVT